MATDRETTQNPRAAQGEAAGGPRCSRRAIIHRSMAAAGGIGAGLVLGAGLPGGTFGAEAQAAGGTSTTAATGALLAANLGFGFRLQQTLVKSGLGQNLFFSPLSISTALAMVYDGAAGATQQVMATALGFKGLRPADVNAASLSILNALRGRDPQVTLSIADSLWLRQGVAAVPSFAAALKTYYGAGCQSLDFSKPSAPGAINAWVSKETHGLIPSIVKSISAATVMFLVNALYFKGAWSERFEAAATQPGPFTTGSGNVVSVPMMVHSGTYQYAKTLTAEAIRLPYASGNISMYIVLPAAKSSLQAFVGGLNAATWTALVRSLTPQYGGIQMPKFSVSYGASLKPALTALGMGQAFDPAKAAFPGIIAHQKAYITDVLHKAIMKVDEQGTLAAAVTSIGVGATAIMQAGFKMVVNRPFFCAIRDDVSGTLLFAGAIVNPEA